MPCHCVFDYRNSLAINCRHSIDELHADCHALSGELSRTLSRQRVYQCLDTARICLVDRMGSRVVGVAKYLVSRSFWAGEWA